MQDETPVPVVQQPADEAPVEEPAPTVGEQPGFNVISFLSGALAGVMGTLVAAFGLVGRLKNDTAALNAIEWLGKSIPVDALNQLNELGRNLRDAGEVLDKVTDGLPNAAQLASSRPVPPGREWLNEGG